MLLQNCSCTCFNVVLETMWVTKVKSVCACALKSTSLPLQSQCLGTLTLKGRAGFVCSPGPHRCISTSPHTLAAAVPLLGARQVIGSCRPGSTWRAGSAAWILMCPCIPQPWWGISSRVHCSAWVLLLLPILLFFWLISSVKELLNKCMTSSKFPGELH